MFLHLIRIVVGFLRVWKSLLVALVIVRFSCALQVKKQMVKCAESGWNFPTFYVIKDSLALMLDGVGLLEDALREFYEVRGRQLWCDKSHNISLVSSSQNASASAYLGFK